MRYRLCANLARICLTAVLLLISASSAAEAATVLRIAHVGHGQGAIHAGAMRFADHLEDVSDGQLRVDIVGRGALGSIPELFAQMQSGALDMQVIDVPAINVLKAGQRMDVLVTPFLFESQSHMRRYFASELARAPLGELATELGIRYVGHVAERSPRIVSTTHRPVRTVEDMAGLKIRVPGVPIFLDVFKAWGSTPTPVAPGGTFMALKTGMVDGEDNGIVNLANGPNSAVIKHVTPIDWVRTVVGLWIADERWASLEDEQRSWIHQAVTASEKDAAIAFDADMLAARTRLDELGIRIHEPDLTGFVAIVDDFVARHEGERWPAGEVERIRALR